MVAAELEFSLVQWDARQPHHTRPAPAGAAPIGGDTYGLDVLNYHQQLLEDVRIACELQDLPFDGVIDWPELLIGFQKVGYDGTLMLELAAASDGATATLRRAGGVRRRLESMLGDTSFTFSEEA